MGPGTSPSCFSHCGDDCPVENVSWSQIQAFIMKLNNLDKRGDYELPTEKQWEYACRSGTQTDYPWGNEASCKKMMYENDSSGKCRSYFDSTAPESPMKVMSFDPTRSTRQDYEIYDMNGNVREWCADEMTDAPSPKQGHLRVVRGGGWDSSAAYCRCGARDGVHKTITSSSLGFRLVFKAKNEGDAK